MRLPQNNHLGARLRRTGFSGFAPSRCASRPFGFNPPLAPLGCPLRAPLAIVRASREKKQRAPVPENSVAKNRHRIFRPRAAAGLQVVTPVFWRRGSSKPSRQPAGGASRPLRAPLRPVPSGCGLGCAPCLSLRLATPRNPAKTRGIPPFRESPAAPRGGGCGEAEAK